MCMCRFCCLRLNCARRVYPPPALQRPVFSSNTIIDVPSLMVWYCFGTAGAKLTQYYMSGTSQSDVQPASTMAATNLTASRSNGVLSGTFTVGVGGWPGVHCCLRHHCHWAKTGAAASEVYSRTCTHPHTHMPRTPAAPLQRQVTIDTAATTPLIFASGPITPSGTPLRHDVDSAADVALGSGAVTATSSSTEPLKTAHGACLLCLLPGRLACCARWNAVHDTRACPCTMCPQLLLLACLPTLRIAQLQTIPSCIHCLQPGSWWSAGAC